MGLQLIICVETNKKTNSDYIYINATIKFFYKIGLANIKISPVYMDGRGNYSSGKINKRINALINEYKAGSKNNESIVIFCFDCDDYDTKPEDKQFLDNAKQYCADNGYRFVWFYKEIENVFWGRTVPDNAKKKEAENFAKKNKIKDLNIDNLKADKYKDGKSNLCSILDDYLIVDNNR